MNHLAHLYLARGDDDLMFGGLLGDFVRGRRVLRNYPVAIGDGIRLHRWIDRYTDDAHDVKVLRRGFPRAFRRYAGIILDLAFDHELARNWPSYCDVPLEEFDARVRRVLAARSALVPERLAGFMRYADRRKLFAAYRSEPEMLHSLAGVGTRLSRPNPLHRVGEIWPDLRKPVRAGFERFFPGLEAAAAQWLKRRSTRMGS